MIKQEPKERFYLWGYSNSLGWKQIGSYDDYKTIGDIYSDNSYKFETNRGLPIIILKAKKLNGDN